MSFSGGVYTLPGPALATGEIVSATENNQFRNDVATAFNLTWLRNGTATATANLPMGGYKLTGLGAATTSGDALSYGAAAVVTTLTSTSLTATRVPYAGTGGLLQDASTFTFDGTTLTAGGFSTAGSITVSGGTANGVAYLNGSKVLTTGSALTFDGTNLTVGGAYQSGAYKLASYVASGNQGISIVNGGNAGSDYAAMSFMQAGTSKATIYTNNDNFTFNANTGAAIYQIAGSEQMRLTSTGLGIGTSSPATKLQVSGASNPILRVTDTRNTVNLDMQPSGTIAYFGTASNHPLAFQTNSAEVMRLDTSGNLGLGVTPSAWSGVTAFQVASSGAIAGNNQYLDFTTNAYYNAGYKYIGTGLAAKYGQAAGQHQWYTAPSGTAGNAISFTQAMTLDASGNLGIGSTSPVSFGANTHGITLDGTGNYQHITWKVNGTLVADAYTNGTSGFIFGTEASAPLQFQTAATERMRIDSSGNVGIGTSSPTAGYRLDVQGASGNIRLQSTTGTNSSSVRLVNTGGDFYLFRDSSTGVDYSGSAYATGLYATGAYPMVFFNNGSERMRIDSSGNVGIGTSSPSSYNGGGFALNTALYNSSNCALTLANSSRHYQLAVAASISNSFGIYDATAAAYRMIIDSSGNLSFNSGYGSAATAYGCRAWVNFNGTGTVAIRASGNVSSITDNGTAAYTVNFTNAMTDANYSASILGSTGSNNALVPRGTTYSTSSLAMTFVTTNTTTVDQATVSVAIFR